MWWSYRFLILRLDVMVVEYDVKLFNFVIIVMDPSQVKQISDGLNWVVSSHHDSKLSATYYY